jgi:uncharacterized phage-associated protein
MSKSREIKPRILSNISDVAKIFLSLEPMTPKKLQKLCYYAYALMYSFSDGEKKLFDVRWEAWIHGPVSPKLYYEYSGYSLYSEIPSPRLVPNMDQSVLSYIENIYKTFKGLTGDQLERMTHNELPWQNAREGLKCNEYSSNWIDDDDILEFYKN